MAVIGYARVSKDEQKPELQHDALERAGCDRVFEDRVSGATTERPQLAEALAYLRSGDVFVVWKLDRFGRSLGHLVDALTKMKAKGVEFRSITEGMDTTTPGGKLMYHIFGALAEFELDLIKERTRAGLSAAEARGRKGGRKRSVTPEKLQRARAHMQAGLTVREAASRVKVGKSALYKALSDDAAVSQQEVGADEQMQAAE